MAAEQSLGDAQDPHGTGPSGSRSVVVSVLMHLRHVLCSPGAIRQLLAGVAAAGVAAAQHGVALARC